MSELDELRQRIAELEKEIEIDDREWIVDGKCKFCGGHPDGKGINKCWCVPTVREYRYENEGQARRIAKLETERNYLSLGLDKANGRILALEQIEGNLKRQRDEARNLVRELSLSAPNDWAKYFVDSWDEEVKP